MKIGDDANHLFPDLMRWAGKIVVHERKRQMPSLPRDQVSALVMIIKQRARFSPHKW